MVAGKYRDDRVGIKGWGAPFAFPTLAVALRPLPNIRWDGLRIKIPSYQWLALVFEVMLYQMQHGSETNHLQVARRHYHNLNRKNVQCPAMRNGC
jgi:hypothetical protein